MDSEEEEKAYCIAVGILALLLLSFTAMQSMRHFPSETEFNIVSQHAGFFMRGI